MTWYGSVRASGAPTRSESRPHQPPWTRGCAAKPTRGAAPAPRLRAIWPRPTAGGLLRQWWTRRGWSRRPPRCSRARPGADTDGNCLTLPCAYRVTRPLGERPRTRPAGPAQRARVPLSAPRQRLPRRQRADRRPLCGRSWREEVGGDTQDLRARPRGQVHRPAHTAEVVGMATVPVPQMRGWAEVTGRVGPGKFAGAREACRSTVG